uniref:Uncharacterized protein n=1 Tax=Plectus sambesii TaxID=2011161 RepID=A0A914UUJ5_9BILA
SFPFPQTHSPVIPNLYGDSRLDDADTSLDDDDPLNTTHGILRRPADIGSFERYSPASDLQLPPPPNATSSPTRLLPYYQTSSGGSGRDEIAYSPPTSMDRSGRPPSHSPLFVSSVDGGDVMYNSRGGSSRNSHNSSGEHQRLHTFKPNARSINDSILVGSFERSRNNPQGSPARLSDD